MNSMRTLERVVKEAVRGKTIPLTRRGENFYLIRADKVDSSLPANELALVWRKRHVEKFFEVSPGLEYLIAQMLFSEGYELHPNYWRY